MEITQMQFIEAKGEIARREDLVTISKFEDGFKVEVIKADSPYREMTYFVERVGFSKFNKFMRIVEGSISIYDKGLYATTNTNIEFDFLKEEEFEFELSEMRHGC